MCDKFFIIVLAIGLIASTGFAQLPMVSDNVGTIGNGQFQLELSNELTSDNLINSKSKCNSTAFCFSHGLNDKVDILFSNSYEVHREIAIADQSQTQGVEDVDVQVKWAFFSNKEHGLASKSGVSIPTGRYNDGFGNGRISYSLYLIYSYELELFSCNMNVGYLRNNNCTDSKFNLFHGSFSIDIPVYSGLHLVGNAGVETNSEFGSNHDPAFALLGFVYYINDGLELSSAYKAGITEPEADHSFLLGLTWRFPK